MTLHILAPERNNKQTNPYPEFYNVINRALLNTDAVRRGYRGIVGNP